MSTITKVEEQKIIDWLATHKLAKGIGTEASACSIAAINLALSGELTDDVPKCMSMVIGRWIIKVQDEMPEKMRNGAKWRRLLPLAAGTGRMHEKERCEILTNWMWDKVLPNAQMVADKRGVGKEWFAMCKERSASAARCVGNSIMATVPHAHRRLGSSALLAAAVVAAHACTLMSVDAADDIAEVVVQVARAVEHIELPFWSRIDPCGVLAKLIEVSNDQ